MGFRIESPRANWLVSISRRASIINKYVGFINFRLLYHISGLMSTRGSSQSRTGLISQSRRGPPRAGQALLEPTGWIPLSSALPLHALGRLGKFLPSIWSPRADGLVFYKTRLCVWLFLDSPTVSRIQCVPEVSRLRSKRGGGFVVGYGEFIMPSVILIVRLNFYSNNHSTKNMI